MKKMKRKENTIKQKAEYKIEIVTGIRPTGDLTVANYLGAIQPIVKLQKKGQRLFVFVADLHGMTDSEPAVTKEFTYEIVADCIALGLNPKKTNLYVQSGIAAEVIALTVFLARHISVAELLRVPTLKDKLKAKSKPETANALLFLYPVLMAADILIQRARNVPVGEDQMAHLEITRDLARRFNRKYGNVFPIPKVFQVRSLRILSLRGSDKMSKTTPEEAIFLTDNEKAVARKIKKAETAFEGKMNQSLKSHILLAKSLTNDRLKQRAIDELIEKHMQGKRVMKEFKQLFTEITQNFLKEFQEKRKEIIKDPTYIPSVLETGTKIARANAIETIELVKQALYQNSN